MRRSLLGLPLLGLPLLGLPLLGLPLLGLPLVVTLACVGGEGRRDTFLTSSEEDTGDGDGDGDPGDGDPGDGDGDPGDGDPGDGDPGDGDGDPGDGDGDPDPACTRSRYTYNTANQSWAAIPLDQAWAGPDAPPCSVEIAATLHIAHWSELFVIGNDGVTYHRVDGVWQPPRTWADSFAALEGEQPTAAVYAPSASDPGLVQLYFTFASGEAAIYDYTDQGGIILSSVTQLMDVEPPGAPQLSEDMRWGFVYYDADMVGVSPDWLIWHMSYTDGFFYTFNAAFTWEQFPEQSNAFFNGAPGEPDPTTLEAAWADEATSRVFFVGPQ